jgi:DNA-binding NtrC family response regulator
MSRILVVDHEADVRIQMESWLLRLNHEVVECRNGMDALEKIRGKSFDLIFLGMNLSGLSSLETLEHVLEAHPSNRVILMASFAQLGIARSALHKGAVTILEKPLQHDEVIRAIEVASQTRARLDKPAAAREIAAADGFKIDFDKLDFQANKEAFEKHFLDSALRAFGGRINQTAIRANIPKKTLLRKLEKYGIRARDYAH